MASDYDPPAVRAGLALAWLASFCLCLWGAPPRAEDAAVAPDASAVVSAPAMPAPASKAQAAPVASPSSTPGSALANPDTTVGPHEVTEAAKGAIVAVQGAMSRPTLLTVVFAISAGLWAILAGIRAFGARWLSARAIRITTLVAAPILTFTSAFGAGMPWFDALVLAGGGPGALLLNELGRGFQPARKV